MDIYVKILSLALPRSVVAVDVINRKIKSDKMEQQKNIFSVLIKEANQRLLQFDSVVSEINELVDSNNLANSNPIDKNFTCTGNNGMLNRNRDCGSTENRESINGVQSDQTNPSNIFIPICGRSDVRRYQNMSLSDNFSSDISTWTVNAAFDCNRNEHSNGHAIASSPKGNYNDYNASNEYMRGHGISSSSNPLSDNCSSDISTRTFDDAFDCNRNDHSNGHAIASVSSPKGNYNDYNASNEYMCGHGISYQSNPIYSYGDATICVSESCTSESVMGVQIPTGYEFDEKQLDCVLKESSSKRLVNYFNNLRGTYDGDNTFRSGMDSVEESQENHISLAENEMMSDVDILEIGLTSEVAEVNVVGTSSQLSVSSSNVATFNTTHRQNGAGWVNEIDFEAADAKLPNATVDFPAHQTFNNNNAFNDGSLVTGEDNFIDCEPIDITHNRGCDNSKMFVPTSDSGPKKYCCKFCKVRVQKLERHLRTVHKNEPDVKKYLIFPPHSAQRRKIILKLQKQGDFAWNNDIELNKGEYAVRRRPNKKFKRDPWDKISCPACLGVYSKSFLTRHWNRECSQNPSVGERGIQQLGRAVEGRLHQNASQELVDIFSSFRESQNIRHVRFDWLVVCYGNELCLNNSPHYQKAYICGKIRAAAKVLLTSKSISSELSDMSSMFHVKYCNTVVDAIRSMGKFDYNTKRFGSPATASSTVTLINTIGDTLLIESMKSDDTEKEREVERFLKVFKKDVRNKISKLVLVSRLEKKRQKKDNIPTTSDINKFAKYLDSEREECFSQLVVKFSYDSWLKLSHLTMISILVYNRRRAGEMQNLLKSDFERREIIANQCDMLLNEIPEAAKKNIKSRLAVRNKLGKKLVPVLLKHHWDVCLELLLRHRTDAGVPEKNEFLFALPTQLEKIRTSNVCSLMRTFSVSCGAENPSSLRGTDLRKHMASFSSTKNLSDNDISNLADFMGHAETVHRTYYRINPLTNQVGKISFLLDSALGNDNPQDNAGDGDAVMSSNDESADESEEYETESEAESLKESRKTAKKKNLKRTPNKQNMKKKTNIKPQPKPRKKSVAKKKTNIKPQPKPRKKSVAKKKTNIKPQPKPRKKSVATPATTEVKKKIKSDAT